MRCNCEPLLKAINQYLIKADDSLEEQLGKEGFADPEGTVEAINYLEEQIANELKVENEEFLEAISSAETLEDVRELLAAWKLSDRLAERLYELLNDYLQEITARFATAYTSQIEPDVGVIELRQRTVAQISTQTETIAQKMKQSSHDDIDRILRNGLEEGKGIGEFVEDFRNSGVHDEYFRARRTSITEVLTANRAAANEAYVQSPAVTGKRWRHTGAYRNQPRQNHVAMDGQIVAAEEPFELNGADGGTYYPQFPGDWILPPGERINCHCISSPVVDDEILGMSYEERQALRQKIIDEDAERFSAEREVNTTGKLEWLKTKDKDGQIKYMGSKQKWALLESGTITDDEMLRSIKLKSLKELEEDGIITIPKATVKHSAVGDFTKLGNPKKPASLKNGGRPCGGGHAQSGLNKLDDLGWSYNITQTYGNGVRVGNIPDHKDSWRKAGSEMSWFPENWTDDDIWVAGTAVANNPDDVYELNAGGTKSGTRLTGTYNDVIVCVTKDNDGKIVSIYPKNEQ